MSLVNDTLSAQCLLEAAENYYEAKRRHDKARDEYTGYSWGYYGRDYVEAMEQAANDFQQRFIKLVQESIKSQL